MLHIWSKAFVFETASNIANNSSYATVPSASVCSKAVSRWFTNITWINSINSRKDAHDDNAYSRHCYARYFTATTCVALELSALIVSRWIAKAIVREHLRYYSSSDNSKKLNTLADRWTSRFVVRMKMTIRVVKGERTFVNSEGWLVENWEADSRLPYLRRKTTRRTTQLIEICISDIHSSWRV